MTNKSRRRLRDPKRLLCAVLLLLTLLSAAFPLCCGEISDPEKSETEDPGATPGLTLDDFSRKKLGILTGSIHDGFAKKRLPEAELLYFSSVSDEATALLSGAIDGFPMDILTVGALMAENPSVTYVDEPFDYIPSSFAFPKNDRGEKLCAEMDAFLAKIEADGTLASLQDKWIAPDAGDHPLDLSSLHGDETLVFATSCAGKPNSYYFEGAPTGYETEIAVLFCREYGYGLQIAVTDFAGIIPGLAGGKYDFGADGIAVTEERKQSVNFSVPDYEAAVVLAVLKTQTGQESAGFFSRLAESFRKTFIREQRWKLIVSGIVTTLIISLGAALLGTLLGFGLCMLRRMRSPVIHGITTVYIRIMQGTPILVLLMILFYIVFAKSEVSGELIAVIAFSLNFAAYTCEIFRSGIDAVDKGQTEAALAIGFTAPQTFLRVVLPQAAINFLPVYKGEFISLVKMTSIVGYIAVQDLTKMSDIIRSRTYEAFFPLIATAVIYFLLSGALTALLGTIEIRIKPDRVNRKVKGAPKK